MSGWWRRKTSVVWGSSFKPVGVVRHTESKFNFMGNIFCGNSFTDVYITKLFFKILLIFWYKVLLCWASGVYKCQFRKSSFPIFTVPIFRVIYNSQITKDGPFVRKPCKTIFKCLGTNWRILNGPTSTWIF